MKATGIVRRIDDLGRVVIPKEIRRTMRIREGDPSVADYIGAVAEILRWNAGSGKTGRVESYILTKSTPSTVDIREGCKGAKSEENRPHWQARRPISVSLYSAGCGKMGLISRGGTYHGRQKAERSDPAL